MQKLLKTELAAELNAILNYWADNSIDTQNGGFIGQIDHNDQKHFDSEKGAVMNARLLWTFSAAYKMQGQKQHKEIAQKAYNYISEYFYDKQSGGIFWSVDADGTPKDTKNQIYAIAFVIYGLSEYSAATADKEVLDLAIDLYKKIERFSFDPVMGGYFEAFTREWEPIADLRLSSKDANEKKTMNTHLHIAEAYANLYKVWPDEGLRHSLVRLLETIDTYFINTETGHLRLFFDENWIENPDVISYGHDIEAAWLLLQCAELSEEQGLIDRYKQHAVLMADAAKKGIDNDGGIWYEFDPKSNELIKEKHWWPQAESMIGFVNAWQLTGNSVYLQIAINNWEFIKQYLLDKQNGEWFWGVYADYSKIQKDKAGFWKCCYHNSRACIEIITRIH